MPQNVRLFLITFSARPESIEHKRTVPLCSGVVVKDDGYVVVFKAGVKIKVEC